MLIFASFWRKSQKKRWNVLSEILFSKWNIFVYDFSNNTSWNGPFKLRLKFYAEFLIYLSVKFDTNLS